MVVSLLQFADVEDAKLSKLRLPAGRGVEALVDSDLLTPKEELAEDHDPFAVRGPLAPQLADGRDAQKPAKMQSATMGVDASQEKRMPP